MQNLNICYDLSYMDSIGAAPDYAELLELFSWKYKLSALYACANSRKRHYKKVGIPKKSGGVRTLHVPDGYLKGLQRAILQNILNKIPVSKYAAAYYKGASLLKNAEVHTGKENVLRLDIHNFFGSITEQTIYALVFYKRFSPRVARLLTALCCYSGALPQGAPTSPALANAVLRAFDDSLGSWCAERDIAYTRYCDDLFFSGEISKKEICKAVRHLLYPLGLSLQKEKTKLSGKGQRRLVTGLTVNKGICVPKAYRQKIRQEMYYCQKFGVSEHLSKQGGGEPVSYLQSLLGKVSFVLQIMPEKMEFMQYKKQILEWIKQCS